MPFTLAFHIVLETTTSHIYIFLWLFIYQNLEPGNSEVASKGCKKRNSGGSSNFLSNRRGTNYLNVILCIRSRVFMCIS
jgi:hypothetical protein